MVIISSLFMNYISSEICCLFTSVSTNNKKETISSSNLQKKMNKEGLMEFMIMKPLWMIVYSIELRFLFCCSTSTSGMTSLHLFQLIFFLFFFSVSVLFFWKFVLYITLFYLSRQIEKIAHFWFHKKREWCFRVFVLIL